MKNNKSIFTFTLAVILAFLFFSCAEDITKEKDDVAAAAAIIGTWIDSSYVSPTDWSTNTYVFADDGSYTNTEVTESGMGPWTNMVRGTYSFAGDVLKMNETAEYNTMITNWDPKTNISWSYAYISGSSIYGLGSGGNLMKRISGTPFQSNSVVALLDYKIYVNSDDVTEGNSNYAQAIIVGTNIIFTNIVGYSMSNDVWTASNWIFSTSVTEGFTLPITTNDGTIMGLWFGPDFSWSGMLTVDWGVNLKTNDISKPSDVFIKQ